MQLYLENGYVNMEALRETGYPFIFIFGGRGIGKTYGALKDLLQNNIKFMLMRRTNSQFELISHPQLSPFKKLNKDLHTTYTAKKTTKYTGAVYDSEDSTSEVMAYTCALATIANIRGFDGSDIDVMLYDEFIPEPHARPIKEEAEALWNSYETINRNRELQGQKPLQLICLSNSNTLDNPVFLSLGLVTKADEMTRKGLEVVRIPERGILLVNLEKSTISEQKAETALYRLTKGSAFATMALDNKFIEQDGSMVTHTRNLREYLPLVTIGEICIYKHKSERTYYVTSHISGSPKHYYTSDSDVSRFRRQNAHLYTAYMERRVLFEQRVCEILFLKFFGA